MTFLDIHVPFFWHCWWGSECCCCWWWDGLVISICGARGHPQSLQALSESPLPSSLLLPLSLSCCMWHSSSNNNESSVWRRFIFLFVAVGQVLGWLEYYNYKRNRPQSSALLCFGPDISIRTALALARARAWTEAIAVSVHWAKNHGIVLGIKLLMFSKSRNVLVSKCNTKLSYF